MIRLTLWLASYRPILKRIIARRAAVVEPQACNPRLIAWAVRHAARVVPGATCLTQALTLGYLLAEKGTYVTIRIGVAGQSSATFRAHAWVVHEGSIILGGGAQEFASYRPLADL